MSLWIALACVTAAAMLLSWFGASMLRTALRRYRETFTTTTRVQLSELFLFIEPAQLWLCNLVVCAFATVAVHLFTGSLVAGVAAGGLCAALPGRLLKHFRQRRRQDFDRQLPDALLALGSALRAGASMATALRHVTRETEPPLAQEFELLMREIRIGVSLDQALRNLADRIPTEACALTTSAMRLAASTGGGLAEALERIAATVRARLHMETRIRALTAQGRLQAWVLGALPALMILVLHRLEPEAMALLWSTPVGWATLTALVLLETLGLWFIRRIVHIDV